MRIRAGGQPGGRCLCNYLSPDRFFFSFRIYTYTISPRFTQCIYFGVPAQALNSDMNTMRHKGQSEFGAERRAAVWAHVGVRPCES